MSGPRTLKMLPHSDLRSVRSLQGEILTALDQGREVTLDCAAIERADMAFVQLILAAGRSAARRGATLTLINRTEGLDSACRRAGLDPADPHTPVH